MAYDFYQHVNERQWVALSNAHSGSVHLDTLSKNKQWGRDGNTAERGRDWDVTSVGMNPLKLHWGMWCRLTLWPKESNLHVFKAAINFMRPNWNSVRGISLTGDVPMWAGHKSPTYSQETVVAGLKIFTSWTALGVHTRTKCISQKCLFLPPAYIGASVAQPWPAISRAGSGEVRSCSTCPAASCLMQLLSGCNTPNLRWHLYNGCFGSKTIFLWSSTWIL